jgi:homoserine O-acetyltransferase
MKSAGAQSSGKEPQDEKIREVQSPLGVTGVQTVTLADVCTRSGFFFDRIEVSYQTLGTLSPARDNAVLVCHALSGSAHVAGIDPDTGRTGWWELHVGPGKAIDTDQFFVVCMNVLGGCNGTTGPASVNPATGRPYGMHFPPVSIRDMVGVQRKVLDHLGIGRLFAVVGGSMGGMQALAWAIDYPDQLQVCVPIATCAAHNAMQIAFNEVGRRAITTDPNWNGGDYTAGRRPEHGLAVARMVGHVTYVSEYAMTHKFGRNRPRQAAPEAGETALFQVESYLHHQGRSFVNRFDPNSYIYLTRALDEFNLFEGRDPGEALERVSARFLVISFASDWLYPAAQSRELVRSLKRANAPVTYINLEVPYGHDSFLIDNAAFAHVLRHYLNNAFYSTQTAPGPEILP